jgi:hypothetical protein
MPSRKVTFKIRFGEVTHAAGDEHRHVQSFEVRRATGDLAPRGAEGDLLVGGRHIGPYVSRALLRWTTRRNQEQGMQQLRRTHHSDARVTGY